MRILIGLATSSLILCGLLLHSASAASKVSRHISPAGQTFFYLPMANAKRTAVAVTWNSGLPTGSGIHESAARLGINLMLSGGSGGLPSDEISAEFEDLDAGARLWVQPGEIKGFVVAPENHLLQAADIANLVLTRPDFAARWLEREKSTLIKDNNVRGATATGIAWTLAREILLVDHPYKRFWATSPTDDVRAISAEQIRTWHETAFGTRDLTITAAGSADPDLVGRAIDVALKGLPNSANRAPLTFSGAQIRPGTIVLHVPDLPKSLIMALGHLPPAKPDNDAGFGIANAVLGLGKQSRLFQAIRTQLRAAYGFGAGTESIARGHRLLRISGEVDTTLLPQALDTMRTSYENFRLNGIAEDEFAIAREFHRQRTQLNIDRPAGSATLLMEHRLNDGSTSDFANLTAQIEELGQTAVNDLISSVYPRYDALLKIVVTPDASALPQACVITAIADWKRCF